MVVLDTDGTNASLPVHAELPASYIFFGCDDLRAGHTTKDNHAMTTVVFGLVLALQVVTAEEGWEDAGTRDGTTLAYRDNRLLNAREVRGTTVLPFAFNAIAPVVCDFTRYPTLVPDIREARVLDGTIPTDYEVYLRYAPRFLVVAARDVVLHVRTDPASEERAGCSWSESNGRVEPRRGTIRMPLLRGTWTIERVDAGQSRVTYQVAARPGGRIPAWLVRRGAIGALPDIISRVHQEVRRLHGVPERPGVSASDRTPLSRRAPIRSPRERPSTY